MQLPLYIYLYIWKPFNIGCNFQDATALTGMLLTDHTSAYFEDEALKSTAPYLACEIVDTGIKYFPVQDTYAMPKQSQFFRAFYYHINSLKETGTVQRYSESYQEQYQVCPDYSGMPITGVQCFTAFIVLVIGATISFLWLG